MYTYLAAFLAGGAVIGTSMWQIQNWRYGAKEAEHVEQQLESQRVAANRAIRQQEAVIAAQNEGQALARRLRLDAAGARATADGLRDDVLRARADAATSIDACIVRANTLGELLITVEEAGRGMAEKAGLHANDIQTLTAAWPKSKE